MIRTKVKLPHSLMPVTKMDLPQTIIELQFTQEQIIQALKRKQKEIEQLTKNLQEIQAKISEEIKKL